METSRRLRVRRCSMNRAKKRRGDWRVWWVKERMRTVNELLARFRSRREGRYKPSKSRYPLYSRFRRAGA